MYASSEGSDDTDKMRKLAWAFAVICDHMWWPNFDVYIYTVKYLFDHLVNLLEFIATIYNL